jgi:hypothetical protein
VTDISNDDACLTLENGIRSPVMNLSKEHVLKTGKKETTLAEIGVGVTPNRF